MIRTINELFLDLSDTQGLVLRILSFLEREEDQSQIPLAFRSDVQKLFPTYATISQGWQYAVERETFSSIALKSSELELFSRIFRPAHRKAFLSSLTYEIVLPTYDDEACGRLESSEEKEANDIAFSEAIHGLFAVLKSWEEDLTKTQFQTQPTPPSFLFTDFELGKRKDLWEHRYEHSVISLQLWEELPTLSCVDGFRATVHWDRVVEPQSIARVASKFPSLEVVDWLLSDDEKKDANVRQKLRLDFARSLKLIPRGRLKSFTLGYHNNAPENHHFILSKAPTLAAEHDELSVALNKISQSPNLSSIFLTGPMAISPDLYQPPPTSAWLKIENFHLTFNICTPSGEWYFEREPDYDSEDGEDGDDDADSDGDLEDDFEEDSPHSSNEDSYNARRHDRQIGKYPISMFRNYPSTEKIFALLEAFATATTHMPMLRRAGLKAGLVRHLGQFEVLFLMAGEAHSLDSAVEGFEVELVRRRPRLYFQTGQWRGDQHREAFDHMLEVFQTTVHVVDGNAHRETGQLLVKFFEW